ncbi:MAG TPA: PRC-barrel domain-containing protein [Alphaproteobacteria bacterium]|jgi:sporulation protein YlmC with PRC-barrel domain
MADITEITTGSLIPAEKVIDSSVYNLEGDKLGSIEDIIIDKVSGRSIYAIMSFGGFLGMGHKHYPLPWSVLDYSKEKGGYVVNIDKELLKNAPGYDDEVEWTPKYGRNVDTYYNAPTYWNE